MTAPNVIAEAGQWLVDTATGEVLRDLDTDRACECCRTVVERRGRTGRPPSYCDDCQTGRRREAAKLRMARLRRAADEHQSRDVALPWWLASDRSEPGNVLVLDARAGIRRRERGTGADTNFDLVMDALGVQAGDSIPLVIDRYVDDETGVLRQGVPRGWHSNAGPPEGYSTYFAELAGLLYGKDGLAAQARRHYWFPEHPAWRHNVHGGDAEQACSHKHQVMPGVAA